jgi:hypothetical protein
VCRHRGGTAQIWRAAVALCNNPARRAIRLPGKDSAGGTAPSHGGYKPRGHLCGCGAACVWLVAVKIMPVETDRKDHVGLPNQGGRVGRGGRSVDGAQETGAVPGRREVKRCFRRLSQTTPPLSKPAGNGNTSFSLRPGALSAISIRALWRRATAATRLRPSPFPHVRRLRSNR